MSHTTNAIVQTAKLVTLGDAIRAKAGLSDEMTIDEMATAVANISTGITPTGSISILTNGTHDVTNYASAVVNVPNPSTGTLSITENGTYNVTSYASADVNVSGGGGTPYDGSHHRSPAGYLVVCILTQGSSTSYFNYCKIYECTNGVKGTLLDSFPSPESYLLVAVTTPQLYFEFSSNGYLTQGGPKCTGGVSYNYDTDDSTYWIVNVSGDGTVTFDGIDWDD